MALAEVVEIASGYVDDILIGTRRDGPTDTLRDLILKHEKYVRAVMEQLLKHRLVASYNKAQLFRLTVEFCWHMFSGSGSKAGTGEADGCIKSAEAADYHCLAGRFGFRELPRFVCQGVCGNRSSFAITVEGG